MIPTKPAPGLDPGVETGFRNKIMHKQNKLREQVEGLPGEER
jgi:hypothetical protein